MQTRKKNHVVLVITEAVGVVVVKLYYWWKRKGTKVQKVASLNPLKKQIVEIRVTKSDLSRRTSSNT